MTVKHLTPIGPPRCDLKLRDQHPHHRCQRYVAGGKVEFVKVDRSPVDRTDLGAECGRDMQMRIIGSLILVSRLPVIDEQLPLITIEQTILIHLGRFMPERTLSLGLRSNDGKAVSEIKVQPPRTA